MSNEDNAPKPRRRKRKILLVMLGLFVLVIAFLPKLAAPFVRGKIESALEDTLDADVAIGSLSLGWGSASVGELTIVDAKGRRHARIESATASAPLLAALKGNYSPTVRIANVELDAERDAEGRWSFEDILPASDPESADKDKDGERDGSSGSPLASADIEIENVTVRVKSPEGHGSFVLSSVKVLQESADAPLTVDANGRLSAASPTSAVLESTFTLDAETDLASLVHHLALEGALLSGTTAGKLLLGDPLTAEGLKADLTYVPDNLAALLGTLLPIEMSGAEPEQLTLDYTGALDATDVEGLLAAGEGKVSIGLGRLAFAGIETGGNIGIDLTGGVAALTGKLDLNGGALTLDGGISPKGGMTLGIGADAVRSTAALSPLLASVHPVFATLDKLEGTGLEGLLSGRLDLAWDGDLPLSAPEGGWAKLPLDRLTGSGRIEVGGAMLNKSPFVGQMLNAFGTNTDRKVNMQPLGFSLKGSRLHYDNDWNWSVAGAATSFSGSVGFDKGLDLKWTVPVSQELAGKAGIAQLAGKTLVLPIGGTALKPKIDWTGALKDLAGSAALDIAKDTALEKLGDKLGDGLGDKLEGALGDKLDGGKVKDLVGDVLGGGGGDDEVSDEAGSNDPKVILAEADALYEKGKKWKASLLYQRLYDDHKLSTVYQLNKSRIKDRREYEK